MKKFGGEVASDCKKNSGQARATVVLLNHKIRAALLGERHEIRQFTTEPLRRGNRYFLSTSPTDDVTAFTAAALGIIDQKRYSLGCCCCC